MWVHQSKQPLLQTRCVYIVIQCCFECWIWLKKITKYTSTLKVMSIKVYFIKYFVFLFLLISISAKTYHHAGGSEQNHTNNIFLDQSVKRYHLSWEVSILVILKVLMAACIVVVKITLNWEKCVNPSHKDLKLIPFMYMFWRLPCVVVDRLPVTDDLLLFMISVTYSLSALMWYLCLCLSSSNCSS